MKEKADEIRFLPEADATQMTVVDECSHTCFYWGAACPGAARGALQNLDGVSHGPTISVLSDRVCTRMT